MERQPTEPTAGIDHINWQTPESVTYCTKGERVEINGWALDRDALLAPAAVFLKLNDDYIFAAEMLTHPIENGLPHPSLGGCGIKCFIDTSDLIPGIYDISAVIVSSNMSYKYEIPMEYAIAITL